MLELLFFVTVFIAVVFNLGDMAFYYATPYKYRKPMKWKYVPGSGYVLFYRWYRGL